MRKATLLGLATLTWLVAAQGMAGAQTPVNATFRCPTAADCVEDAISGDGTQQDGFDFQGVRSWTTGKKGNVRTYYDGAYLNANGGIDINLVPSPTDAVNPQRAVNFHLAGLIPVPRSRASSACKAADFTATELDFRFNVSNAPGGILSLDPGQTVTGLDGLVGVVNFGSTVSGSLFFNDSHDGATTWYGGNLSLHRDLDNPSLFVLTSDSSVVLFRCNGSDVGTYPVSFQLRVFVPLP